MVRPERKVALESRNLVDVAEASRLTGLARPTLYKLAQEGRLRSFKVLNRALRFDRSDLIALVDERPARSSTT
jgi:excisionase family DNA binding protein